MLAPLRHFLGRGRRTLHRRWTRAVVVAVPLIFLVNLAVFLDRTAVKSLPARILGGKSFHPKPFAPSPHGLESQGSGRLDYWTWDTPTQFQKNEDVAWDGVVAGVMDECVLYPVHLLSKVQVVLKVGAADDWSRTEAQLSTIIKCIPNVLITSDGNHTYGPDRQAVDVLKNLPAETYLKGDDYAVYATQQNATRTGGKLQQGHEGWRIDKYKFLPGVEYAIERNPAAEWYVFLESDTYIFWDNVFRLLENYDCSLPYYFGSPSPGRKYRPTSSSSEEKQTWFAYGGAGFILSTAAAQRLISRPRNTLGIKGPCLTEEYKDDIRADCCGDSILGWALHDKAAVSLSGLYPMFNPHDLDSLPFIPSHACIPLISLHKTVPASFAALSALETTHRRETPLPLLLADLLTSDSMPARRNDWDAAFAAGFQVPDEAPAHTSLDACESACHEHNDCVQWTWHGAHCYFARELYLGRAKGPDGEHAEEDRRYVSGWDQAAVELFGREKCTEPHWVKPSIGRKY
jgi:hypothetical protein